MSTTTQYVMSKAIHFTTKKHYGRVGDVMMYQPPKVTIYRGGKLMTSFDLSRAAVEALIKNGVMRSVEHAEAEPQAPSPEFTEKLSAALAERPDPLHSLPVLVPELPPAPVAVPEPPVLEAVALEAVAQILTAELGPEDDGSLPDEAEPVIEPVAPEAAPEAAAPEAAPKPKSSRRAKAAAAIEPTA